MRKFQIGDIVEYVNNYNLYMRLTQGNIYTVEEIYDNDYIIISGNSDYPFHISKFILRLDLMRDDKLNQLLK